MIQTNRSAERSRSKEPIPSAKRLQIPEWMDKSVRSDFCSFSFYEADLNVGKMYLVKHTQLCLDYGRLTGLQTCIDTKTHLKQLYI